MNIDSHVQLPNGILKYFQDENDSQKRVWYLDITDGEIKRKSSKKLGTVHGYFSEEIEQFLSREIESPFTQLNASIRKFIEIKDPSFSLNPQNEQALKKFIIASAARSNLTLEEMKKNSVTHFLFSDQNNHDFIVDFGINIDGAFSNLINGLSMGIIENKTPCTFVVPRNCFYVVPRGDDGIIVCPISPDIALVLEKTDGVSKDIPLYEIDNIYDIVNFNCRV